MSQGPAYLETYAKLIIYEFRWRMRHLGVSGVVPLTGEEISSLLSLASALALSGKQERQARTSERTIAFDIVTRLATLVPDSALVRSAAAYVLARLGNFPSIELLAAGEVATAAAPTNLLLDFEALQRTEENTIQITRDYAQALTDFQYDLFALLQRGVPVSVSAPTSAGKSFILSLDIARRLWKCAGLTIVYLVPTRALIRQVMRDLAERLRALDVAAVAILSAPISLPADKERVGTIYVLTQERLMTLLFAPSPVKIDVMYVDEAQEIEAPDRGIILHTAIAHTLRRFPQLPVIFSTPLTSNPTFLHDEFQIGRRGLTLRELESPVSQTLLFLSRVGWEDYKVDVHALIGTRLRYVARATLPFRFRGVVPRLARTAFSFTQESEASIVYVNRPDDAEEAAEIIADLSTTPTELAPEIDEFIEFIKVHITDQYGLIDLLRKRVAFHYSQMPGLVRVGVEELLKAKKLRFVCCTSTLLQGVNLPAKNIFIQAPRRGNGKPMNTAAFWNLAGRAGRLRDTFSGNVWCLEVDKWKHNPLQGERLTEITSAFREALASKNGLDDILTRIGDRSLPSDGSAEEQAFAKIFAEFTLADETLAESHFATDENRSRLARIDVECAKLRDEIHLPREILEKNAAISPWRLEALYRMFSNSKDVGRYLPVDPRGGGVASIRKVFYVIERVFIRSNKRSYRFFAALAFFWIRGDTLAHMIASRIRYRKLTDKKAINDEIRKLLGELENELHFRYVKYVRAYIDVLDYYLRSIGRLNLVQRIAPLHMFIEFGASDPVLLSLMSLGLSRTTAILLQRNIGRGWTPIKDRNDLVRRLSHINFARAQIPKVCQREIEDFIGV